VGDAEAQSASGTRSQLEVAAEPVVAGRGASPGPGLNLLPGAVAPVSVSTRQKPLRRLPVPGPALGLKERPLVPVDAEPGHGRGDGLDPLGAAPLFVGVLHAEDPGPPSPQ